MNMQQNKVSYPHTATDFLQHAAGTLGERGKQYDTGGKQERSMAKIVAAFNAVHDANGAQLTEQQGWAFMMLLKMVRGAHTPHLDSALDAVGYAALYGECVAEQLAQQEAAEVDKLMGEINAGTKHCPVCDAAHDVEATCCRVCNHAWDDPEPTTASADDLPYSHMRSRVAELDAMLQEALDTQAIIENRNDNLVAQLAEANVGYEQLQDKLRTAEEALRLSSAARYDEIERNKQLTIRNDELHTELSQALKELTYIRAECAARTERLVLLRNKHDTLLNLVQHIDHKARLCAPMQGRLDAILKLTANA